EFRRVLSRSHPRRRGEPDPPGRATPARQDRRPGCLPRRPLGALRGGHHSPEEREHRAAAGVDHRPPFGGQGPAGRVPSDPGRPGQHQRRRPGPLPRPARRQTRCHPCQYTTRNRSRPRPRRHPARTADPSAPTPRPGRGDRRPRDPDARPRDRSDPALMAIKGVGPVVGAQLLLTAGDNPDRLRSSPSFAALCGTAPIPVSSGRTDRHRLSRGGDRHANAALHRIATNRVSSDPATRAYRDSRIEKGWTVPAVYRSLKRAIAREVFQALIGNCAVPNYSDLRPARQAKNITLTTVAAALGVWPSRVGELELGRRRDDDFANRYRQWLTAA